MKIGDQETQIEFGEADKDGDVLVAIEQYFGQTREYVLLNQKDLERLIAHLQKQLITHE